VSETILTARHDGWVEITLNRPDRRNALNEEMHLALRAALEEAAGDETCRAILLTGNGKGFCAGQDLGDRDPRKMDGPPNLSETLNKFYNPLIRLIRAAPKPVVCAVNGVAAGAGANIALACDIVLAAEGARFIQAFAKLGLVPDAGGTWQLTRLVGEARAKGLALTAQPITA
jgi:2-(1,2-epoxy-1,2-dihydrophenyl)acetyl-CoA isomerase